MYKRILVPLDGSQLATNALHPALALAKANEGIIVLLRVPVYQKQLLPEKVAAVYNRLRPPEEKEWVQQRMQRYLRSVRQLTLGQEISLETLVIDGEPASVIVDTAESEIVDLIVMSTHGRSGLARWWLGSVTQKVLRAARHPVLIVRSDKVPAGMLITLDGSATAEAALEPARQIALSLGIPLSLLRVLEPLDTTDIDQTLPDNEVEQLMQQLAEARQEEAVAYLEQVKASLQVPDEIVVDTAVLVGPPADIILDFAQSNKIDLIAMSSHGQSAEARWAYGSVTEKVIHRADQAVLVVRPQPANAN